MDTDAKVATVGTIGKSITLTREDVVNDLKPVVIDILRDSVESLIDHGDILPFNHFRNLNEKNNEELADLWCDLISDHFLNVNPDIEDVVMLVDDGKKSGVKEKIWLASK